MLAKPVGYIQLVAPFPGGNECRSAGADRVRIPDYQMPGIFCRRLSAENRQGHLSGSDMDQQKRCSKRCFYGECRLRIDSSHDMMPDA